MPPLPSIFDLCVPRSVILSGNLPDSIFAADLWDVITDRAHPDYQDPRSFFAGTYPTEKLKILVKDVTERLAGVPGINPAFVLETGFGGGKTHSLIATVHAARSGHTIPDVLSDYGIRQMPEPGATCVAAFVGENSDPLSGKEIRVENENIRTFTPWGQIALMAGGRAGYAVIRENDIHGVAPSGDALEQSLGNGPVLILIDELMLYMARVKALPADHLLAGLDTQWPVFLQTLFGVAEHRPHTAVILTLPSVQDANSRITEELKQFIPTVLQTVDDARKIASREAQFLTPTQSTERAAVLARRLFQSVDLSRAGDLSHAWVHYLETQRQAGVQIDSRAFEPGYTEQIRTGYPFHPELIRLFAERLADIPEFQSTRGALRLVARTIRSVWQQRDHEAETCLLLQPHHVDLSHSDIRDEILARLDKTAFQRGLEADVVRPDGGTHANQVESGWSWKAASQSALIAFLHSLPDSSKGITSPEVALAVGRPEVDLAYVAKGLEETERIAWYMRKDGERYRFQTRASINKRFHEHYGKVQTSEIRETLDQWIQDIYSDFSSFQVIPFPVDHTLVPDQPDKIRMILVHYDKECGTIGEGSKLNFPKALFQITGVNRTARIYRNNLIFLLCEKTRVDPMKESVRTLTAWERVLKDIGIEQKNTADDAGMDSETLKKRIQHGAGGIPPEFLHLENDLLQVREKIGPLELNVRTRILDAYRVLAFPPVNTDRGSGLFQVFKSAPVLECFRVDFGVIPAADSKKRKNHREVTEETPILQCLRDNSKLVPEPTPEKQVVLAPEMVKSQPIWVPGESCLSTEEVWLRFRRESGAPMLLKQTDLLPTIRAGIQKNPDSLWVYYNQPEKKVFIKDTVDSLIPVIQPEHFLYEPKKAVNGGIWPMVQINPQDVWDHLWPRSDNVPDERTTLNQLAENARISQYFPVLPSKDVLWSSLKQGAAENRWILYLNTNLSIGPDEIHEWPTIPRTEEQTKLWHYMAAIAQGIYPRKKDTDTGGIEFSLPMTSENLKKHCWQTGDQLQTEIMEQKAKHIWQNIHRTQVIDAIQDGLTSGLWGIWEKSPDPVFYTKEDTIDAIAIAPEWILVEPSSELAKKLESCRPGMKMKRVEYSGTPQEIFNNLSEQVEAFTDIGISELILTVTSRDAFDNTLRATWADRPPSAAVSARIHAVGQREIDERSETISLEYDGRFEEITGLLAPIWSFEKDNGLELTITVSFKFDPPVEKDDSGLINYQHAMTEANQGTMQATLVPVRRSLDGERK